MRQKGEMSGDKSLCFKFLVSQTLVVMWDGRGGIICLNGFLIPVTSAQLEIFHL